MKLIISKILALFFAKKTSHLIVVFQNNAELRGSGGFMTQFVDLSLGRMRISCKFPKDYQDLSPKKFIQAPPEIKKFLRHNNWPIRDTNIFGDFKLSAEQITENYTSIYPENYVAGVIAVNLNVLEKVMKILGTIKLNAKNYTANNIFFALSTHIANINFNDLKELDNRKNILKDLSLKIIKTCVKKFWKIPKIYKLMAESLQTKDLQVFFHNKKWNDQLCKKGISKHFSSEKNKDFLAIVENNYLGLKSNRYMRRTVWHDVNFDLNKATKKLADAYVVTKIEWKHNGLFNYPLSGTYQSSTNIFLPPNLIYLKILEAQEAPEITKTPEFTIIKFHNMMQVNSTLSAKIEYKIAAEHFQDDTYSFKFIKQSGVEHEHIHETVRFPDQFHAELINGTEKNFSLTDSIVSHDMANTDRDFNYVIKAALHHQPPRIFYHEIIAPNTIAIKFNESVFADEKFNIKITNKEQTETYLVKDHEFLNDQRHLFIQVDLPNEENKLFHIALAGIHNIVKTPLINRNITVEYQSLRFR